MSRAAGGRGRSRSDVVCPGRVPEIGGGKDPSLQRPALPCSPAPQEAWTVRLGLDLAGHFLLHSEGEITPFGPGAQLPSSRSCGWDHTPCGVSGLQVTQFFYSHCTVSEIGTGITMDLLPKVLQIMYF